MHNQKLRLFLPFYRDYRENKSGPILGKSDPSIENVKLQCSVQQKGAVRHSERCELPRNTFFSFSSVHLYIYYDRRFPQLASIISLIVSAYASSFQT